MLARVVHEWQVGAKFLSIELWIYVPIKYAETDYWYARETYVEKLDVPLVKYCHRTKATEVCVEIVWHRQNHILVEKVQDEL